MILTVRLDARLEALLNRVARARKAKKSEVVRIALREYLNRMEHEQEPASFRVIADLVGSVEGPPDLSCNVKKYVEKRLSRGG